MSRTILNSSNTAVVISNSPAFKTVNDSGYLFAGVRSASFGFAIDRQDMKQIGSQGFADENTTRHPNVTLQMTYGFTPTFANEELLGINYNLDSKPSDSITKDLEGKSYNFYFYNNPDQGSDGVEFIKNGVFPDGGEVVCIGNSYLTNYALNFAVGSFPTVDVRFNCSNIKTENYFSQFLESPAINLDSGNNYGVGSIDLTDVNYLDPRKFGDIYDLDRSDIETILPYDINFEMNNLVIGGQKMSTESHRINNFSLDIPVGRADLYRLGSDYVCDRKIEYPLNATLSFSSLVSKHEAGFISGILKEEQISNLTIRTSDCRKQITSQFYFENLKLESAEYQTLVNEQTNYDLKFSLQIYDDRGFKSSITEQDIGVTRFIDQDNVVFDYILGDVIQNWNSGETSGVKVSFGEITDFDVFDGAFADCINIDQPIYIPKTISFFGDSVFNGCINLPGFYSDSETKITSFGDECFKNCESLQDIFLPESIITIGDSCFENCFSAEALFLQEVVNIGDRAFYNNSGLNENLFLPDSVVNLGESSFENCSGFQGGLYIGSSLKEIKQKTFKNARGLSFDLKIPNNISGIGVEAFYQCESFNGILELSSGLSSIEDYTFYECNSLRGNLIIPENVNEVKIGAFQGCSSFDGFLELSNTNIIGDAAFSGCSDLSSKLKFKSGILSVGDRAFMGCSSFSSSLNIPSGINSIGDAAFSGCVGINDVFINSPLSVFQGNDAFLGINGCMYVSPFYFNDYKTASVAGKYQGMPVCYGSLDTIIYDANTSAIIKFTRGNIPSGWYSNQTTSSFLVIGSTCKSIDSYAFTDSVGLQGLLVIPEEVEYIGDYAFKGCSFEDELFIPDNVLYLGSGAFENCSGFNDFLILGDGINKIYEKTFKNCSNLIGDILLPDITYIGDEAFYNCGGFDGEIFMGFVNQYIGDYAFYNCSSLTGALEISDGVEYIGDYAFYNCSSINEELTMSEDVVYIGDYAFAECANMLGGIFLPESLEYLGSGAFKNCKGLNSSIDLEPTKITSIQYETFFGCSGLSGPLVIPDRVLSIGDYSFKGCTSLTESITITNIAARNIGIDAFDGPVFDELIVSDFVEEIYGGDFDYFKNDSMFLTLQQGLNSIYTDAFANYSFIGDLELPPTLSYIGDGAFSGVSTFGGFYSFESSLVYYIGRGAFYDLNLIGGDLSFPTTLLEIGDYAFYNNSSVDGSINFGPLTSGIGEYAFYNCSSAVGDLIIPNSVSGLGQHAFENCSSLDGVISLPNNENYNTIKTGTFKNCSSLSGDLLVHDFITFIEPDAFLGCVGLDGDITITDIAASTLTNAFDNCPFVKLIISDSVISIENTEFDYFAARPIEVVFQEGLSGILDGAFDNYSFVGLLNLPNSLVTIGNSAFENCDGFNSPLIIPENVDAIGIDAFRSCNNLSGNLTLPAFISNVGDGSFIDCTSLDGYLQISDLTASSISSYNNVFANTNFIELRASSSDSIISDTEFDSFNNVNWTLTITDSVSELGIRAFDGYSFTNQLFLSQSTTSIGDYAFSGDNFIGDLFVSSPNIGEGAFYNCDNFDGRFIFDFTIETVGDYAFYNCSNLSGDLIIPDLATTIGDYSFYNMNSLNGEFSLINLPETFDGNLNSESITISGVEFESGGLTTSLVSFGNYAFAENSNLSGNLVIPSNVTNWGDYAFLNMSSLNGFLILGSGSNVIPEGIFKNCSNLKCYDDGIFRIPENVSLIEEEAFYNCSSLNCDLRLKPGTTIFANAFFNHNFKNLIVPNGTTSIINGDYDYFQPDQLGLIFESPTNSFVTIGDNAFDNYNLTGNLNIPSTVTYLGDFAFYNNILLQGDIVIPDNIKDIGDAIFQNCSSFDGAIYYADNITNIGSGTFKNCSNVSGEISLPLTLVSVGPEAFMGCSNLEGILGIPGGITSIDSYAFSGCNGISGVVINNTDVGAFIGEGAFSGIGGVLELGPLVFTEYANDPSTITIGNKQYFQGIEISGIGASETKFYTGASDDINFRVLQDELSSINNQTYSIPEEWKEGLANDTKSGFEGLNTQQQDCWLEVGSVCQAVGERAFKNRREMRGTLSFPGSVQIIADEAFLDNNQVDTLSFANNGLKDIRFAAFKTCSKIENDIEFPVTLESIANQAFQFTSNLGSLTFQGSLSGIGDYAFNFAAQDIPTTDSTFVQFNEGLINIGLEAFSRSEYQQYNLSNSIENIGSKAFYLAGKASNRAGPEDDFKRFQLNLPTNLTSIGSRSFEACSALGPITIPAGLKILPYRSFHWNHLTDILNFENLDYIGEDALSRSPNLAFASTNKVVQIKSDLVFGIRAMGYNGYNQSRNNFNGQTFERLGTDGFTGVVFDDVYSSQNMADQTFIRCAKIREVNLGGLDYVNDRTFENCPQFALTESLLSENKCSGFGIGAFRSCGNSNVIGELGIYNPDPNLECRYHNIFLPSGIKFLDVGCLEDLKSASGVKFDPLISGLHIGNTSFQNLGNNYSTYRPGKYSSTFAGLTQNPVGIYSDIEIPTNTKHIGDFAFRFAYAPESNFTVPSDYSGSYTEGLPTTEANLAGKNLFQQATFKSLSGFNGMDYVPQNFATDLTLFGSGDNLNICGGASKFGYACMQDVKFRSGEFPITFKFSQNLDYISTYAFASWGNSNLTNYKWVSGFADVTNTPLYAPYRSFETLDFSALIPNTNNPDGIFIANQAFQRSLVSGTLQLPKIRSAGYRMLTGCPYLENVVMTDSPAWTTLEFETFLGCSSLTGLTFNDNFITIKDDNFFNCTSLTDIDIRTTDIETIGNRCFQNCTSLTNVKLCNGFIRELGNDIFKNCTSLDVLDICDTIDTVGSNAFNGAIINQLNYNVDTDTLTANLFNNATIGVLNLPTTTIYIENSVFENCVFGPDPFNNIPNSVTTFGDNVFRGTLLSGIVMPTSLTGLSNSTFENNNFITGLDFSVCSTFSGIGNFNFRNCDNLSGTLFPNSLEVIGNENWKNCPNFSGVDLSNTNLKTIGDSNFVDSNNINSVLLPSTLEQMGNTNFSNTSIQDFVMPNLKNMGDGNFINAEPGGVTPWATQPFELPNSIETIGNNNWEDCDAIQELVIELGFSGAIGNNNWDSCGQLSDLKIKTTNTNASIGSNNFINCLLLQTVEIDCGSGFWIGTNNFQGIPFNATIKVNNTYLSEYNSTWSGLQSVPNGVTILGYNP